MSAEVYARDQSLPIRRGRTRARRVIALTAGMLMCVLCARLGLWQVHRAEEKAALAQRFDAAGTPRAMVRASNLSEWERVSLHGRWLPAQTVYLDNRVRNQVAGFDVLTPFRLDGDGGIVIVDRGWVAGTGDRRHLPEVPLHDGADSISGLVMAPARGFSLGESAEEPRVWQRIDTGRFAHRLGEPVAPVVLRQESAANDDLVREWPRPDFGIDMHRGYALQWFIFSALAAVLTLWFGWRGARNREST